MSVKFNIVEGSIKTPKYLEEPKCPGMEAVHHPEARAWIGPKMKLSEHFEKFSTLVNKSRYETLTKTNETRKVRQLMEGFGPSALDDKLFNEVMQTCDIKRFS